MTIKEKKQLVKDILARDKFTGASIPWYQHVPQLEKYLGGIKGGRNCEQRAKDQKFDEYDWKGKTVLDFGCDNGMMLYECYKRGAKLTVGIQHPEVGDEAERVAKLIGNKSAKFYGIDLARATLDDIRKAVGREQFDVVLYLGMGSFFGTYKDYLYDLTKEMLMYERLSGNADKVVDIMAWLRKLGFKRVEELGPNTDIKEVYGFSEPSVIMRAMR